VPPPIIWFTNWPAERSIMFNPSPLMALRNVFCSGHGLICSATGTAFDEVVTPEKVRTVVETAQEKRREIAARAQSMFKASAGRFPHIESTFCSLTGDVETLFVRNGRLADISVIAPARSTCRRLLGFELLA
jgi:hypothetical protein